MTDKVVASRPFPRGSMRDSLLKDRRTLGQCLSIGSMKVDKLDSSEGIELAV